MHGSHSVLREHGGRSISRHVLHAWEEHVARKSYTSAARHIRMLEWCMSHVMNAITFMRFRSDAWRRHVYVSTFYNAAQLTLSLCGSVLTTILVLHAWVQLLTHLATSDDCDMARLSSDRCCMQSCDTCNHRVHVSHCSSIPMIAHTHAGNVHLRACFMRRATHTSVRIYCTRSAIIESTQAVRTTRKPHTNTHELWCYAHVCLIS